MSRAARFRLVGWVVGVVFFGSLADPAPVRGQDDDALVVRMPPPAVDDFEGETNADGSPVGWYNLRDAKVIPEGGVVGPRFVRFEQHKPGREARLSRAFGVDGSKYEAIVISLWVKLDQINTGERQGQEPGLLIDFLGEKLRQVSRGTLGPWTNNAFASQPASRWTRVSKRIPILPGTKDAILSVGLCGGTGVLDIDGITFELVPVGGEATNNLVKNEGFELGDPDPFGWSAENGARRGFPGFRSQACLELASRGARGLTGLALPVERLLALAVTAQVKATGLRGAGGARALFFFLDDTGRPLSGLETGIGVFLWSDSFDWREYRADVQVPKGAVRAVFQIEKTDGLGSIRLDDVVITASPDAESLSWTPYHVEDDIDRWPEVSTASKIQPDSALDFSFLVEGKAAERGAVTVRDGRLRFKKSGARARFFGVQLLPPTAFLTGERADALADRLARSGVNLVRLGDLDAPLGPDRSLFDDTRDDTKEFDPNALARLDHLIAALKARGISYAIELQGARRYRSEDGVTLPGSLPAGGGPAALFDAGLTKKATENARALLKHVNPETKLALKDDPSVAWVTLAGELTLFDLIEHPGILSGDYLAEYRALASKSNAGTARRTWQALETAHWKELADVLRKDGLAAPIAAVSHWRREREFDEVQAAAGFDLVDDRIGWEGPAWISPRYRSMLWSLDGGLIPVANQKRRPDRPYVLGQWCDFTQGVWSSPFEAAEQLLAAETAVSEDWDALVRRGVFIYPEVWGSSAPGTAGAEDIFQIVEAANAAPHVFALWPHAASVMLRGQATAKEKAAKEKEKEKDKARNEPAQGPYRATARGRRHGVPGWEPDRGRLVIDTPYTQGVAGWPGGETVTLDPLVFDVGNLYATVVASSVGREPLARARRLLVTAVARVEPTGFRWVDGWKREAATPGLPPLRQEPVQASVLWKRKGPVRAYVLDNGGARLRPAKVEKSEDGTRLVIEGNEGALHWELEAE